MSLDAPLPPSPPVNGGSVVPPSRIVAIGASAGGLEALQFAYFTRRPGSVLAVDPGEHRGRAFGRAGLELDPGQRFPGLAQRPLE